MPKIGGPSLPPQYPRPQEPTGPAAPRQPASPPPTPASVNSEQVAQQFGTAFNSAGKLASQLVKGLFTGAPAQPRQAASSNNKAALPRGGAALRGGDTVQGESTSRSSTRHTRGGEAEAEGGDTQGHSSDSHPEMGLLGSAFAALKRARQDRTRRSRRKRAGKAGAAREVDSYHALEEDDEEDVAQRTSMRTWLQGEVEENAFDDARREARLLEQMELQGEAPSRILGQLNGQLSEDRGAAFKRLLSDEVRPQLDRLATRVHEVPTDERRRMSALVSRAMHQVGAQNAPTFDKLLHSTVDAEALHLADAAAPVATRAEELSLALRRAASPTYRAALISRGQGLIEALGQDVADLSAEQLPPVIGSLLHTGETLTGASATAFADAFLTGLLSRPETAGAFFVALAPALRDAPAAGFWALQLLLVLAARGEVNLAQYQAGVLHVLLREARERCKHDVLALRTLKPQSAGREAPSREQELWRQLDTTASLMVRLMPACGAMYALRERLPAPLADEALLALGELDLVSATAPGQQVVRQALLEQERGEWTFLSALPSVAFDLCEPRIVQALSGGLALPMSMIGGEMYLKRVAIQTGRALTGPVVAWSQKGDAAAARQLLRSALYINAPLFGLGSTGLDRAAALLEDLRSRPQPSQERLFMKLMELSRKHPTPQRTGSIEGLRGLVTALARRDPQAARREVLLNPNSEGPARHTTLQITAVQATLARTQQQEREAAAREKEARTRAKRPPGSKPPPGSGR